MQPTALPLAIPIRHLDYYLIHIFLFWLFTMIGKKPEFTSSLSTEQIYFTQS